uniref:Movement protein n=1 Tax=Chrysanthemum virus D TaxID=3078488 RepID=A0AA96PVL1_9VIRU|nr:movement protein [Chrysanthemum virus D]
MEEEHALVVREGVNQFGLSLWQRPIGNHEEGIEDDEIEMLEEEGQWETPEGPGKSRLFNLTRMVSKATPTEQSPSGRIFQRVSHSLAEFSGPTSNIRSRHSLFSSSANPLPQLRGRSLTSWTPTARILNSNQPCENSPSPATKKSGSLLRRLTGRSGTT